VYVAFHVLADDPKYRPARDLFTKLGIPPPFDDAGTPTPGWQAPTTTTRSLVETVSGLTYPPFDAVAEVIAPRKSAVSSFWKRLSKERTDLKNDLVTIAANNAQQKAADTVFPLLAYYHPQSTEVAQYYAAIRKPIPQQRMWFNPVDRWLLEQELAGMDCLIGPDRKPLPSTNGAVTVRQQAWTLPVPLHGVRIEMAAICANPVTFRVLALNGKGAEIEISPRECIIRETGIAVPLATIPLIFDLAQEPMPMEIEVRDQNVSARIGGMTIGGGILSQGYAYRRVALVGSLAAQSLRIRYLAALPESTVAIAATPPPWVAERNTDLAQSMTVAFVDTALEEVAAMLSTLSGASIVLDDSAQPLRDLPITMTADDLALGKVLEWLEKLSDVRAQPTETGFVLRWKP
jgi:hypothetical protein